MKKSIRFKIIFIFLVILFIFGLNTLWSIVNFNRLSRSIDNIMESNYKSIEAAQNMDSAIERQDSSELAYMFSQNENSKAIFIENEKIFIASLSKAEGNITEEGEKKIVSEINHHYMEYLSQFSELWEMDQIENTTEVHDFYYTNILPLFETIKNNLRELTILNQNAMIERKDRAHDVAIRATISTVAISIATILFSFLLISIVSNKIVKPLHDLIEKIKQISKGNLDQKLSIRGNDEIAELAQEFNIMAEKLVRRDQQRIVTLQEEKNKSEAIVSSISDGMIVLDHEHRLILVNDKAERIFGIRQEEVENKHLLEVINNQSLFSLFKKVNDHPYDTSLKKYDTLQLQQEDVINYYKVSVRPVKMKTGDSYGMVALFQDITKFKEIDQMKSDFISSVSHEFRTPLTSITMGVGLLLEETSGKLSDDQKELIQTIQEDSQRLNKLVQELLDLSKLESGRMQLTFEKLDLYEIIKNLERSFRLPLEEIGAQLNYDQLKNSKPVTADSSKITWVFSNLISNAIRYLPKDGSGQIEIKSKVIYNQEVVSVRDNGQGMSSKLKERIFEKFIQGEKNVGGSGLGLAIAKEIIKAHGGDIWVESEEEKGTTFFFTLSVSD